MDPHPTLARTATNASSIHSQAHMQGFSGRPNFPYPNGMTRTEQQPASSPSTPANNTMIKPDNNIINRKAGRDQSLYHICLNLRQRLGEVPGLAEDLKTIEEQEQDEEEMDPVTKMWKYLRRGYPLVMLYNALDPAQPIDVDPSKVAESKMGKARTFKFLQACMNELKFSPADCFLITDLYEENTTGFVKVTKVVNRVLDKLSEEGRLYESSEPVQVNIGQLSAPLKKTAAGHVIQELIDTERDYLQHLETLQAFKKELEESGSVPGDIIHNIFLNLNALLDFAQRFLIKIELHCEVPMEQQNWGRVFAQYAESFSVYEPFIANEQTRQKTLNDEWDKIQAAGQISSEFQQMVSVPSILSGFLLKPFQRLAKYPLLLKELRTKGKLSEDLQADLLAGEEAMQTILRRANRILEKQELQNSLTDLDVRVDDWKGHKLEHFGDLLLCGPFTVVKSDGVGKDVEREVRNHFDSHAFDQKQWFRDIFVSENGQPELYQLYLFERILLCCKDVNANKQKNKMLGKDKPMLAKNGKPRLQLKGRIFIQNVTDVVTMKKSGDYTMRIYWKGDPGVENFVIRFINDEQLNKWEIAFNEQRDKAIQNQRAHSVSNGTSTTEFTYMKTQSGELKNPYLQAENDDDDDDDDDLLPPQINGYAKEGQSEFSMSRNASNNSLRSRSATSGSGTSSSTSTVRMPPPSRFPYPDQMPSLHTNIPQNAAVSPGERGGDSYFSPTLESPISTRSSSQSGMFPFPRQPPPPNGWSNEDMNRYTAPATSRNPSREGPNGHSVNGRPSVQRPSLPAMSASQSSQQVMMMQSRMRSASTPDIHSGNPGAPRRYANGQPPIDNVPVPPIPAHMASMRAPLNRSQTNSPAPHGMPMRGMNQSPGAQSHRAPHPGSNSRGPPPHGPMEDGHTRHHWNGSSGQLPDGVPAVSRGQDYEQHQAHSAPLQSPPPSLQDLMPSQLKARILVGENYVTLIIPTNIGFQTLIDRIDAKLSRSSLGSITANSLRIRYRDVDGDLVTIDNDEAIQDAIMDWRDQNKEKLQAGDFRVIGDIDLFCQLFDVPKDDSKM